VLTEVAANSRAWIANIYPFNDCDRIIYVAQLRMSGAGAWTAASIETPSLAVTTEEIEQFIAALQEVVRIYNEWQLEQSPDIAHGVG